MGRLANLGVFFLMCEGSVTNGVIPSSYLWPGGHDLLCRTVPLPAGGNGDGPCPPELRWLLTVICLVRIANMVVKWKVLDDWLYL